MHSQPNNMDSPDTPVDFDQWRELVDLDNDPERLAEGLEAIDIQEACLELMDELDLRIGKIELQEKVLLTEPEMVLSLLVDRPDGRGNVMRGLRIEGDELEGEHWQIVEDFLVDLNTRLGAIGYSEKQALLARTFDATRYQVSNELVFSFSRQTPLRKAREILRDQYSTWVARQENEQIDAQTAQADGPSVRPRI